VYPPIKSLMPQLHTVPSANKDEIDCAGTNITGAIESSRSCGYRLGLTRVGVPASIVGNVNPGNFLRYPTQNPSSWSRADAHCNEIVAFLDSSSVR